MLWWPSTSSCIWYGNKELSGIRGQRIYILVKEANDIPRTAKAMLATLWAEGVGSFEVSKSGSLLERSLFDSSVFQTNRMDFAAGALCHDGLEQRRGSPVIIEGSTEVVDSKIAIPEPTKEQTNKADSNKNAIKLTLKNAAENIKESWKRERISAIRRDNPEMPLDAIQNITKSAIEQNELIGEWKITIINSENSRQQISISQCLDAPDNYDGVLTLDPLEPDYNNERVVGKLYLKSGRPRLHSFAHGGRVFFLKKQQQKIETLKGSERVTTDKTISALMETNEVFNFGADLILVGNDGEQHLLNEHSLSYTLGGYVQYWSSKEVAKIGSIEILEDPPTKVCKNILALGSSRKLNKLDAIITAPIIRKDGSILCSHGYDISSRLYLHSNNGSLPIVHANPTIREAEIALSILMKPFEDFPLESNLDKSVLLAAILTAVLRPILDVAPAFAFDAPVMV